MYLILFHTEHLHYQCKSFQNHLPMHSGETCGYTKLLHIINSNKLFKEQLKADFTNFFVHICMLLNNTHDIQTHGHCKLSYESFVNIFEDCNVVWHIKFTSILIEWLHMTNLAVGTELKTQKKQWDWAFSRQSWIHRRGSLDLTLTNVVFGLIF